MSVALADLVTELQDWVPPTDGRPIAAQYQSSIKTAVMAFSNIAGMIKRFVLDIEIGQNTYNLPSDFIKIIRFERFGEDDTIVQPGGQLIALGKEYEGEGYYIAGRTITITPQPLYPRKQPIWYKAGYVLGAGSAYADMTDEVALIIMLKARAHLMTVLAADASYDGWKYAIGDVSVDKTGLSKAIHSQIDLLNSQFDKLASDYVGPQGLRATYTRSERGQSSII